jgi:hypothetical protein
VPWITSWLGRYPTLSRCPLQRVNFKKDPAGLALLFSLKHDFPTEWHQFLRSTDSKFTAQLKREYFPYFAQGKKIKITELQPYTLKAGKLEEGASVVSDLSALDTALKEKGAFDLVLSFAKEREAFVVIKYTLED